MQTTGGGVSGPIGRKTQGSLERLLRERQQQSVEANSRAGVREQDHLDPKEVTGALMDHLQRDGFVPGGHNVNDYTPMDFAKEIYMWPGRVYDSADRQVRGLFNLGGQVVENTLNDQAPLEGIEGSPIVHETWHNLTDPVGYANREPAAFMMDLAGGAGLAAKGAGLARGAVESAAARAGGTPAAWLADDTGAVGRLGRYLEAEASTGNEIDNIHNLTSSYGDDYASMVPSAESVPDVLPNGRRLGATSRVRGSASNPELGLVKHFEEPGLGLLKPDDQGWFDQAGPELAYQELNNEIMRRLQLEEAPVRMPGSARGSFDYYGTHQHGSSAAPLERFYTAGDEGVTPSKGLVQEYVTGARDVKSSAEAKNIVESMDNARDMQNIALLDYITGNKDRSLAGHNLMEYQNRPLAIDQGFGFASLDPDLRFISGDTFAPTPQQWPGLRLDARHREILTAARDALKDSLSPFDETGAVRPYNAIYENAGEAEIQAAIERINNAMQRDTLYDMSGNTHMPQQVGINAWDDLEQPGQVVFDPAAAQSLLDRILNPGQTRGSSAEVPIANSGPGPGLDEILEFINQRISGL